MASQLPRMEFPFADTGSEPFDSCVREGTVPALGDTGILLAGWRMLNHPPGEVVLGRGQADGVDWELIS